MSDFYKPYIQQRRFPPFASLLWSQEFESCSTEIVGKTMESHSFEQPDQYSHLRQKMEK